jgi:hypothetical protein
MQHVRREPDGEAEPDGLEVAAQDLCDAVHRRDYKAVAEAMRAAFELMEAEPHAEAPHPEE